MNSYYRRLALAISLVSALSISGAAKQNAPASTDSLLVGAQDWPSVGGNLGDTHYSALEQINRTNVKSLGAAWISKKFEDGAASRVTPVVNDGLMFLSAGTRVYALNARTGDFVWSYQSGSGVAPSPSDLAAFARSSTNALPNNQGVAVGDGKVFVGVTTGHLIALDEKTGKLVWNKDVGYNPPRKIQEVSSPPVYANGIVFCSLTSPEIYVGQAIALDAKDGHELWRFRTIPGPGEPGHETWPQNSDTWRMGGANVWHPFLVDPELGLVFNGTGSADPIQGGEIRAGNNLYTNTVIALDMKTGKLRWYQQLVHHDIWDTDIATPLAFYDAQVGGQTRKGIAVIRSDGYLFLLDRATGKPLIPVREQPVQQNEFDKTAPTQPYPEGANSILADCADWKGKIPAGFVLSCSPFTPPTLRPENVLAPHMGVRLQPMSYDPQTGYFYAQGTAALQWRRRAEDPYYWLNGTHIPGLNQLSFSVVAAVDSRTDKVVWKAKLPSTGTFGSGGVLSTAGGLVFHPRGDGNLEAYDAKTGDLLWAFQTGRAGAAATPISYQVDGQQYVAIIMGPEVWSFRLGGAVPARPAPNVPAPSAGDPFVGPIQDADMITSVSLSQAVGYGGGEHYFIDEYSFNPYRTRVKAGAPVTFGNNGKISHTFAALDGSWTTPRLLPNENVTLTFDKPGTYTFICKEHPWSYGELIVVANSGGNAGGGTASQGGPAPAREAQGGFPAQVQRGKAAYTQGCSSCHLSDLSGNGAAAPALVGNEFMGHWAGRSAGDMLDKIRTTMPTGAAGSLSQGAYLDILAYILQANEIRVEKGLSPETLKNLTLGK